MLVSALSETDTSDPLVVPGENDEDLLNFSDWKRCRTGKARKAVTQKIEEERASGSMILMGRTFSSREVRLEDNPRDYIVSCRGRWANMGGGKKITNSGKGEILRTQRLSLCGCTKGLLDSIPCDTKNHRSRGGAWSERREEATWEGGWGTSTDGGREGVFSR